MACLDDAKAELRVEALGALGEIGSAARPALSRTKAALARDSAEDVRRAAAFALPRIDPKDASVLASLIDGLRDSAASVRGASAESLGKLGDRAASAVPLLINRLDDQSEFCVWAPNQRCMQFKATLPGIG